MASKLPRSDVNLAPKTHISSICFLPLDPKTNVPTPTLLWLKSHATRRVGARMGPYISTWPGVPRAPSSCGRIYYVSNSSDLFDIIEVVVCLANETARRLTRALCSKVVFGRFVLKCRIPKNVDAPLLQHDSLAEFVSRPLGAPHVPSRNLARSITASAALMLPCIGRRFLQRNGCANLLLPFKLLFDQHRSLAMRSTCSTK